MRGRATTPGPAHFVGLVQATPLKQALLDDVLAAQQRQPLRRDPVLAVDDAGERAGDGRRRVGIVAEVDGGEHAIRVAVSVREAPKRRLEGIEDVPAREDLAAGLADTHAATRRDLARRGARDELAGGVHHPHAGLGRGRVRVRDRRDGADLVVGRVRERERNGTHERAVAVVPLAAKAVAEAQRRGRRGADIEKPAARVRELRPKSWTH